MIEIIFNNLFALTDFFIVQFLALSLFLVIIFALMYIIDK